MRGNCCACKSSEPPAPKTRGRKKKQPAMIDWIDCDSCKRWFHATCMRISSAQMESISEFQFFCDSCSVRGCLVRKPQPQATQGAVSNGEIDKLAKIIQDLSSQLSKLQSELDAIRTVSKKQFDCIQNKLRNEQRCDDVQSRLTSNICEKLEAIEKGARIMQSCSRVVNSCRLAINKIPHQEGENVGAIVKSVLDLLDCTCEVSNVTNCFRIPVAASKWSDRSLSPTIVVVLNSTESRRKILQRYFERHKTAKLCNLKNGPRLDYRFTLNEVLSINTFRLRNFALRLKQRNLVKSVFVRNDKLSVLLPGQKRYVPIETVVQLGELTGVPPDEENSQNSSIFFDAISADLSASSRC